MEACTADIKLWMTENLLQQNDAKMNYMIVASPQHLSKTILPTLNIGGFEIHPSESVKNVGVIFDKCLTMEEQVNQMCKSANRQLYMIGKIRNALSRRSAEKLVHAFVTTNIDNGNALLYGIKKEDSIKIQRVLNTGARTIFKKCKYDPVTQLLRELHWLPVEKRIDYKILMMAFKAQNEPDYPIYMKDMLTSQMSVHTSTRSMRPQQKFRLLNPKTKMKSGERAYSKAAPQLWNILHHGVRASDTVPIYKSALKTTLYHRWLTEKNLT